MKKTKREWVRWDKDTFNTPERLYVYKWRKLIDQKELAEKCGVCTGLVREVIYGNRRDLHDILKTAKEMIKELAQTAA